MMPRDTRGERFWSRTPGTEFQLPPWALWSVLAVYIVILVTSAVHHEMWRDEVRALSFARVGSSFPAMLQNLRHEGHPAVWYTLLRVAYSSFGSVLVLPVISGIIAVASVYLVLWYSPLSAVQKVLFAFGIFPLYEYSVMSRNYGIGMLLVFGLFVLYPIRNHRPVLWGAVIAVLANTSVHAAIIALALLAGWVWACWCETPSRCPLRQRPFVLAGIALAVVGVLYCAYLVMPDPETTVTQVFNLTPAGVAVALRDSFLNPGEVFADLLPDVRRGLSVVLINALFLAIAIGLWRRWTLLVTFVAAVVGMATFFRIGYPGDLRHVGLLFVLILCLYWRVLIEDNHSMPSPATRLRVYWTLTVPLTLMLAWHVVVGQRRVIADYQGERTSSKSFGNLLKHPAYHRAIVIGEPDYFVESLPYYASNHMYIPREGKFASYVKFTRARRDRISLGDLLGQAQRVHLLTGRPVLIALGHEEVLTRDSGDVAFSYSSSFTWSPAERDLFLRSTRQIMGFHPTITDERYAVFEVRGGPGFGRKLTTPVLIGGHPALLGDH